MSGPNGDLGMPAEAGVEGEDDGFGEAGDPGGLLKRPLLSQGCLLERRIGVGLGTWKGPQSPPTPRSWVGCSCGRWLEVQGERQ